MSARPTFAEYRDIAAVNWSSLKHLRDSPMHYRYRLDNPEPDTPARLLGRAAHVAILEPDRFPLVCAVYEGETRRGKEWDAFKAANAGRDILKADEYALCLAMRDAVRASPVAAPYLVSGTPERTIVWRDQETGLDCKGRIDWLTKDRHGIVLVDVKTTASVDPRRFGATAAKLGYHMQLGGMYKPGLVAIGEAPHKVVILAVEQKPPHDVAVYEMPDDALHIGRTEVDALLTKLAYHRKTDTWPGRFAEEQLLDLPDWINGDLDITTEE